MPASQLKEAPGWDAREQSQADSAPLIEIYRRSMLIYRMDTRLRSMLQSGAMAMQYYSARGQEVISAGISVHLTPEDYVVTNYRGIHDQIAKGVPLRELIAEFAGRVTGTCKGKGGPMHVTHPASGIMVTTGIVGAGLPIANGLALSSQLRGDGRVTVCNFGDGATNIGAFHESLNMASLWKLPIVFLCQNNGIAEHTRYEHGTTSATIADRGISYSMRSVTVDGNDPEAMWAAAKEAVAHARSGEGPTLLEAKTIRLLGHNFGDTRDYIPKDEQEADKLKDPLPIFRNRLLAGVATEEELSAIEAEIDEAVRDAIEFALASPYPDESEGLTDVYGETVQ